MDGDLDSTGDGLWLNDGLGYFTKSSEGQIGNVNDALVRDFDGDGWLDVLAGGSRKLWLGFGDGTFAEAAVGVWLARRWRRIRASVGASRRDGRSDMQRWRIGAVTISAVLEAQDVFDGGFVARHVLPMATPAALAALPWLAPSWLDAQGGPKLVSQAFLVESQGRRIVVDTCVGNDKERRNPAFHALQRPFLAELARAGAAPEDVDVVLCTHLHFDHVGWNTRFDGARWVPTFPNARYLLARAEWEHWRANGRIDYVFADSLQPVMDAGLVDLVATDHTVTDEVSLVATPGHTPGHVSIRIASQGVEACITGDLLHHASQVGRPDWIGPADSDPEQARATRERFLDDAAARDVVVVGTHFPAPAAGRVRLDGAGGRRLTPEGPAPCAPNNLRAAERGTR